MVVVTVHGFLIDAEAVRDVSTEAVRDVSIEAEAVIQDDEVLIEVVHVEQEQDVLIEAELGSVWMSELSACALPHQTNASGNSKITI